jgi:hypothetical protein
MSILLAMVQSLALTGAKLPTLDPAQVALPHTLLASERGLEFLGPGVEPPAQAQRVDASGLFLIPGLIDAFCYFDPEHDQHYSDAGVLALCDQGGDVATLMDFAPAAARAVSFGPALRSAGHLLEGPPPSTPQSIVLQDEHGAEHALSALRELGVDFLAIQRTLPRAAWAEVLELAHDPRAGLPEASELPSPRRLQVWGPAPNGVDLEELLDAGQDGLVYLDAFAPEGMPWDELEPQCCEREPMAGRIARAGAARLRVVPMLSTWARLVEADPDRQARALAELDPRWAALWKAERTSRELALVPGEREKLERGLARRREVLLALDRAGARLVPGSGAPHPWLSPGAGLVRELIEWERAGLSSARVLDLATRGAAEALEWVGRGRLAPGAQPDLLALRADPTQGIAALEQLEFVVVRGRLWSRSAREAARSQRAARYAERRAALEQPLAIPEPDAPQGERLLAGYSETLSGVGRLAAERWAVVREAGGALNFCGRRLTPGSASVPDLTVHVIQRVVDGKLERFVVRAVSAGHELLARGLRVGESWRIERRTDGSFLDNRTAREALSAVDVDSATTAMLLAHTRGEGSFFVLRFDQGLEGEVVRWDLALEPDGDRWLRTPSGLRAQRFLPSGALEAQRVQLGAHVLLTLSRELSESGGGLPLATKPRAGAPQDGQDGEPR